MFHVLIANAVPVTILQAYIYVLTAIRLTTDGLLRHIYVLTAIGGQQF